jgi:hypothetical protein
MKRIITEKESRKRSASTTKMWANPEYRKRLVSQQRQLGFRNYPTNN